LKTAVWRSSVGCGGCCGVDGDLLRWADTCCTRLVPFWSEWESRVADMSLKQTRWGLYTYAYHQCSEDFPRSGLRSGRMTPKADADGGCVGNYGVWCSTSCGLKKILGRFLSFFTGHDRPLCNYPAIDSWSRRRVFGCRACSQSYTRVSFDGSLGVTRPRIHFPAAFLPYQRQHHQKWQKHVPDGCKRNGSCPDSNRGPLAIDVVKP
jgi:hypothetical protein